jgi:hypothetical protein
VSIVFGDVQGFGTAGVLLAIGAKVKLELGFRHAVS